MNGEIMEKIKLDLGCGPFTKDGFVGIDNRALPNVGIVHDLEVFPYPIEDEGCSEIRAHHVLEHIKPWYTVDVMNELWRIMVPDGILDISVPYAGSSNFWQDPTHCNGFIEMTFWYFDPEVFGSGLYTIYTPKPWRICSGPTHQENSNLDIILSKRSLP
jgi:hypothetical protein